jgi:hypothetical protein
MKSLQQTILWLFSTLFCISVLNTLNIPGHFDDDYEFPYLYLIPKLHKTLYKDTLLVPKMFYKTFTKILTTAKERRQMYCATVYARSGVN